MILRSAAASLAVVGLLASGCSQGDAKPRSLPTLSPTAPPSVSSVTVPSAAREHTAFGAAAFVRFYYSRLNQAFSTPDARALDGLSDPECGTCKSYIAAATQFRRDGQHVQGQSTRVIFAEAPPEQKGVVAVDVLFDAPARSIVDGAGKVVRSLPAENRYHRTVYLKRVQQGWLLRAVQKAS